MKPGQGFTTRWRMLLHSLSTPSIPALIQFNLDPFFNWIMINQFCQFWLLLSLCLYCSMKCSTVPIWPLNFNRLSIVLPYTILVWPFVTHMTSWDDLAPYLTSTIMMERLSLVPYYTKLVNLFQNHSLLQTLIWSFWSGT